jgi:hypothetical protein
MTSTTLQSTERPTEVMPLACEISRAVCRHVDAQVRQFETSPEDSLGELSQPTENRKERALNCEPSQFTWFDFHALNQTDPDLGLQRWSEVKEAAKQEFQSGHRAAAANEGTLSASAWQRAQFLAVRDGLASDWKPQNGIEWSLIEMMAQAYATQLFWQERMMCYACLELENEQMKNDCRFRHPRVSDSQAVDQAAQMVDRFNRIYMRSLRALRDLRRHAPTLIMHNVEQVNVAENQVNVDVT